MRIVIAPDKFKGCLDAPGVAAAIAEGVRKADQAFDLVLCPVADGGEGTVAALVEATGGRLIHRNVTGPLPEMKVTAGFGILGGGETAVIEMAAASGLALLSEADRNPMATTSFGTGELIRNAAEMGVKHIIVGLGGSATVDGGIGCAQACGHTMILEDGEPVSMSEPLTGADVSRVVLIKRHRGEATDRVKITIASDVNNVLCGSHGAAKVFGPQKGATPSQVTTLDEALHQLATRCSAQSVAETPGAGAAGGLGFGLMAFFGAEMLPGFPLIAETVKLADHLRDADLCFTGEGRMDGQTAHGKTVAGVAALCKAADVPCIALVGSIGEEAASVLAHGITSYFSICPRPMHLDEAMQNAATLLTDTAFRVTELYRIQRKREVIL